MSSQPHPTLRYTCSGGYRSSRDCGVPAGDAVQPEQRLPEASPLTGVIEYIVGQDLCRMVGYKGYDEITRGIRPDESIGWGHITCDGSIANYEAVW